MPPKLALAVSIVFILFVFYMEWRRTPEVSRAIILPFVWYGISASRPIGVWLTIWGFPLTSGFVDPTEGSFIDRWFLTVLIIIGVIILSRRQCEWNRIVKENKWLLALFIFMAFSILWSDYPMVSFKRFIKSVGTVVMVLIVLTETKPTEAVCTVIRRCAYFFVPLSIVTVRYFRQVGINWDWAGKAESWIGIATSKNTLGQMAVVSALFFIWNFFTSYHRAEGKAIDLIYIVMSLYLLKGSDDAVSMTSFVLLFFAIAMLVIFQLLKGNIGRIRSVSISTLFMILIALVSVIGLSVGSSQEDSLLKTIIMSMDRDPTLTGRTEIWRDVFDIASRNPLLGVGFGGFWIGSLVNVPWSADMTWVLGQAHNGYVDIYLQLGWIGILLFTGVVFSSMSQIMKSSFLDIEYGIFRMIMFLIILFMNITESTFLRGMHAMWFIFLLVILTVPSRSNNSKLDSKVSRGMAKSRREFAEDVRADQMLSL